MRSLLLLLSGCSLVATGGSRTTPAGTTVCEASYAPAVVDSLLAVAGIAAIVYSATDPDTGETDGHALTNREAAVYPGVVLAIPFTMTAVYGYAKVARCQRAARRK